MYLPPGQALTTPPPSSSCGDKEFSCGDSQQCIPTSQVCDFQSDCSNGADEARCGACDFSNDMCGLENHYPNARFAWNWMKVQDGKRNRGFPTTDYELSKNGAYVAYSLKNQDVPAGTQYLATPSLGQVAHSCVVSFSYFIPDGLYSTFTFGVLPHSTADKRSGSVIPLAVFSGFQNKGKWVKASVRTANWDAGVRFYYEANTPGTSIGQVEYLNCHPDAHAAGSEASKKVSCDFTNPLDCGWFPERSAADVPWELSSGRVGAMVSEWQPTDGASQKGTYMFAQNRYATKKTAHLVSLKMSPTPGKGRCFIFWYFMRHPNSGQLHLLQRVGNASLSLLWARTGPQGKSWQQGRVQVYSDEPHQFVFEAVMEPRNPAVIAIDDFTLKDGECDAARVCTFESGSCGWSLLNWEVTKGSSATLPEIDHSNQAPEGSFALLKAADGRMVSPPGWYNESKHKCLRFWFFIMGTTTETLNVTQQLGKDLEETVWYGSATDAPKERWYSAAAELRPVSGQNTVVFQGITSGNSGTVVAVDDVVLGETSCPRPGSCSFEEDMCNWHNNGGPQQALWYRSSGHTVSLSGTLEKDHTLGTAEGHYLLLDAEDLSPQHVAILQSQTLALGPAVCFQLYYHRKKGAFATLNVTFVDPSGTPVGQTATIDPEAPSDWTLLSVQQDHLPSRFSILITGRSGAYGGDVAIDDIDVRPGQCKEAQGATTTTLVPATMIPVPSPTTVAPLESTTAAEESTTAAPVTEEPNTSASEDVVTSTPFATPPPTPSLECPSGHFNCGDDATCIPSVLLCDGVPDCPNGQDEMCESGKSCKEGQFFCATQSPSACLPRSMLCDGHEDCVGGSDESMCRECPIYLCLNGGVCTWTPAEPSPSCGCKDGYGGHRCERLTRSMPDTDTQKTNGAGGASTVLTAVLVVLALAITAVVVAVVMLRRRKRLGAASSDLSITNPTYDATTEETKLFN